MNRYQKAERYERIYREMKLKHKPSKWAWQRLSKQVLRNLVAESKSVRGGRCG